MKLSRLVFLSSMLCASSALADSNVSGTVFDSAHHPIAGADVELLAKEGATLAQTNTDGHGQFRFRLPVSVAGSLLLHASKEGVGDAVVDPKADSAVEIVLIAPKEIGGRSVIAGERPLSPPQTGASVAVLSRQQIEALPGGDSRPLSTVLTTQVGFVADTFGFGVHVRGEDGGILWVLDGVPMMAAPLGQWGAAGGFIPTRLIQNLTIFTGGFPAEYGSGHGGVIDITTRRGLGDPEGTVALSYGTFNMGDVMANYSQQIGKLGVFVGGDFQSTDRGLDPPDVSPIIHDHADIGSFFARLDYDLHERDRLVFTGSYTQSQFQIPIDPTLLPLSDAPPGAIRGPDMYGNAPPPFVPYNSNPTDAERDLFASLSYQHRGDIVTSLVTPFVRESYNNLLCDPTDSLGPTADPGSTCSNVGRDVWHGGVVTSFAWKAWENHDWKAGALVDYARGNVTYTSFTRNDASPQGGADPSLTLSGRDITNTTSAGAFVQDRIAIGKWTLFPGVRADLLSVTFAEAGEPSLLMAGPSARFGATYAPNDSIVLHGSAGYLWQPPNTVDGVAAARVLVPSLAGQPIPFDLKPERDIEGELGITGRIVHGLNVGLTGWARYAWDMLDRQNVGDTNLIASYNYKQGRAVGVEASVNGRAGKYLDGFANAGWQIAQGQGIDSEAYLFTPAQAAQNAPWATLDHTQAWTVNVGLDLHDEKADTHLSGLFNYGSGLRTGPFNDETIPGHAIFNMTLRHRFDFPLRPEVAVDVFNLFDDIYAYRIATGDVGSAYAPTRMVVVRLIVNLPK